MAHDEMSLAHYRVVDCPLLHILLVLVFCPLSRGSLHLVLLHFLSKEKVEWAAGGLHNGRAWVGALDARLLIQLEPPQLSGILAVFQYEVLYWGCALEMGM